MMLPLVLLIKFVLLLIIFQLSFSFNLLAPVVQRLDDAIHRINQHPLDSVVCLLNIYPLDSDLSGG